MGPRWGWGLCKGLGRGQSVAVWQTVQDASAFLLFFFFSFAEPEGEVTDQTEERPAKAGTSLRENLGGYT